MIKKLITRLKNWYKIKIKGVSVPKYLSGKQ